MTSTLFSVHNLNLLHWSLQMPTQKLNYLKQHSDDTITVVSSPEHLSQMVVYKLPHFY